MTCDELKDRLAERALSPEEPDADLEAHLASCSGCRERTSVLESALRRLPAIVGREAAPLSPELRERIVAASGATPVRWGRGLAVVAFLAAAVSVSVLLAPRVLPPAVSVTVSEEETLSPSKAGSRTEVKIPESGESRFDGTADTAAVGSAPTLALDAPTILARAGIARVQLKRLAADGAITSSECGVYLARLGEPAAISSEQLSRLEEELTRRQDLMNGQKNKPAAEANEASAKETERGAANLDATIESR
jgi:hypothetical protein